jgi:hypothetical protein
VSKYDIEEKYRVIKRGLIKLKLDYHYAKKHDTATCPETGAKTTIPRSSIVDKYTVGSICDFLIENGYTDKDIKRVFKWK